MLILLFEMDVSLELRVLSHETYVLIRLPKLWTVLKLELFKHDEIRDEQFLEEENVDVFIDEVRA